MCLRYTPARVIFFLEPCSYPWVLALFMVRAVPSFGTFGKHLPERVCEEHENVAHPVELRNV